MRRNECHSWISFFVKFKWGIVILWVGLVLSLPAQAEGGNPCASQTLTVSPTFPRYLSNKTKPAGTVWWTGTWNWVLLGCTSGPIAYANHQAFSLQLGGTSLTPINGVSGYRIKSATAPTVRVLNNSPCAVSQVPDTNGYLWRLYFSIPANTSCDYEFTLTNSQIISTGTAVGFSFNGLRETNGQPSNGFQTPLVYGTGFTPGPYYQALYPMFKADNFYTKGNSFPNLQTNYDKNVSLVNATCSFAQQNVIVSLPSTTLSVMKNANATAGLTAFQTNLNCDANLVAYNVQTTLNYTAASGVVNAIANPESSSASKNAYIQILNANLTALASGTSFSNSISTSGGTVTNTFFARYISAGNPTPGSIKGVATLTLSYP